MIKKIKYSIDKFNLDLSNKVILTEAATGAYSCTPIIADLANASTIYALAKPTKYGSIEDIKNTFVPYYDKHMDSNIKIITSLDEIDKSIDIVTNSGFMRPINSNLINYMHNKSVITLMYEPWEFRKDDIDLELMYSNDIKVYGTNEHDNRLKTMDYIGITVLYHLLDNKISNFSNSKILILGNEEFTSPIESILLTNNYKIKILNNYNDTFTDYDYDIYVVAENKQNNYIVGTQNAYIDKTKLTKEQFVIHICGNVDFKNVDFKHKPEMPKPFGYMSYRTDYIDDMALIDLQTASLHVAEGMLVANNKNFNSFQYKDFMEKNYPALSFKDKKFW